MFRQLIARIQDDDNPRLHHLSFMMLWIASFATGWFALEIVTTVLLSLQTDTIFKIVIDAFKHSPEWMKGLATGLIFGLIVTQIQTWSLRRRYGFVPKFWRTATMLGALVAGWWFPILSHTYNWYTTDIWMNTAIWFLAIPLFQSFVLARVSRYWWLMAWVGLCAGLFAAGISLLEWGVYNALSAGLAIQIVGSGLIVLRLMTATHKDSVHKGIEQRLSDVKKAFHPITFVALWVIAHFMGWALFWGLDSYFREFDFAYVLGDWFVAYEATWILAIIRGAMIGLVAAASQKWLMQRQSNATFRYWIVLSTVAYSIAAIAIFEYFWYLPMSKTEGGLMALCIWFTVPTLVQTIPMWKAMRGAWIWGGTGIVTSMIALLMSSKIHWHDSMIYNTLIFSSFVYVILTACTFLLLLSQQTDPAHPTVKMRRVVGVAL